MLEKKEMKPRNVVDAEIAQEQLPEAPLPRCELTIGLGEAGNVYYRIAGTDQSLITIEGLLKYAEIEMNRLWAATITRPEEVAGE